MKCILLICKGSAQNMEMAYKMKTEKSIAKIAIIMNRMFSTAINNNTIYPLISLLTVCNVSLITIVQRSILQLSHVLSYLSCKCIL